jgi:hypothetical protein
MTIWRLRGECWIPKATHIHTHTEYVIGIAVLVQQWLLERASMLRHTYFASRVLCSISLVVFITVAE